MHTLNCIHLQFAWEKRQVFPSADHVQYLHLIHMALPLAELWKDLEELPIRSTCSTNRNVVTTLDSPRMTYLLEKVSSEDTSFNRYVSQHPLLIGLLQNILFYCTFTHQSKYQITVCQSLTKALTMQWINGLSKSLRDQSSMPPTVVDFKYYVYLY